MTFATWLAFCAATIVILTIPGPTVLLVLGYAMSYGRRVALACVLGVALGDFLAISVALSGLGALLLASSSAFLIVKWIGAAYLIYMGWRMWQSAGDQAQQAGHTPIKSTRQVFTDAAVVTAFNPKSITFFIAFVPQFITAGQPLPPQFAIIITSFVALAALNALIYALGADYMTQKIGHQRLMPNLRRLGGGALILMGVFAALKRP